MHNVRPRDWFIVETEATVDVLTWHQEHNVCEYKVMRYLLSLPDR